MSQNEVIPLSIYLFDRIESFLTCEHGWDDVEDAVPTNCKIVAECLQVLRLAKLHGFPEPGLCMGYGGEICILWQKTEFYIFVEVYGDGTPIALASIGEDIQTATHKGFESLPKIVVESMTLFQNSTVA